MIRKLTSGEYRLYSRKKDSKTGRRRNRGTFGSPQTSIQSNDRSTALRQPRYASSR